MKRIVALVIGLLGIGFLTGCSTTKYQEYQGGRSGGYTEQKIDDTTYLVKFQANHSSDAETHNNLMIRCGDLAFTKGFAYFYVVSADFEGNNEQSATIKLTNANDSRFPHAFPAVKIGACQHHKGLCAFNGAVPVEQVPTTFITAGDVSSHTVFGKSALNSGVSRETLVNNRGYRLLMHGKFDEAIAVFQKNVKDYPKSWNTYESLAEGYATRLVNVHEQGDKNLAIDAYGKALAMAPAYWKEPIKDAIAKVDVIAKSYGVKDASIITTTPAPTSWIVDHPITVSK